MGFHGTPAEYDALKKKAAAGVASPGELQQLGKLASAGNSSARSAIGKSDGNKWGILGN